MHTYSHDALGRVSARTQTRGSAAARSDSFGYNARSELASATLGSDEYAYAFDYIGNRSMATEKDASLSYVTNSLNQYSGIASSGEATFQSLVENPSEENSFSTFSPTYDLDGNATLIRTSTGTWSITYNGENRPIRFENAATQTVVECAYDSQGRRFEKKVTVAGTVTLHERYVYDGYLQIAAFDVSTDAEGTESFALKRVIFWDPEEPTATRPLAINVLGDNLYFPMVDLTKNVCELVDFYGDVAATYDYAPFGAVTARMPSGASVPANPFQWSSEVYDDELGLVYYNYRHYSPADGRFLSRDPIEEQGGWNLYSYCENKVLDFTDSNGEIIVDQWLFPAEKTYACCGGKSYDTSASCCVDNEIHSKSEIAYTGVSYYVNRTRWYYIPIFRPWSISQFFLQHAWFNIGNGEWRAGSYPNSDIPSGINIGEEEYAKKEGDTLTFKTDIKLSVCEYDAKKFSSCVKNKAALGNNWHLWNNCLDWVYDTIDTCKNEVKRK